MAVATVTVKSTGLWHVTPCSSERAKRQAESPDSAGFLLEVLFDPEDGCGMFLFNAGLSANYTALHQRRQ